MHFVVPHSYTDEIYFNIIYFQSFSSSSPPPLVSFNSPTTENMFFIYVYVSYIYDNACIWIWICLPYMRENSYGCASVVIISCLTFLQIYVPKCYDHKVVLFLAFFFFCGTGV
jgi:hypothetical protein